MTVEKVMKSKFFSSPDDYDQLISDIVEFDDKNAGEALEAVPEFADEDSDASGGSSDDTGGLAYI